MTNGNGRVDLLEDAVMRLVNIAQDHSTMLTNQQRILEEHTNILRAHSTILTNQQRIMEEQTGILRALTENVDELRRDARHTQRLWIRLAQKNGWLDDEDLWDERDS